VVDACRTRIPNLARSLTAATAAGQEVLAGLRQPIESAALTPLNDEASDLQVNASPGAPAAPAGGEKVTEGAARRSVPLVAEEGLEPPTRGL
jgi:hypothetical protein